MFLEVIYREEVVRRNNMNKDRDELTQWGRAIKHSNSLSTMSSSRFSVQFYCPLLLLQRKERIERVDIGSRFLLSFISHFTPASKGDIDVNTYLSGTMLST